MERKCSDKEFYTIPFVWSKTLWVMTFALFIFWFGISAFLLYGVCTEEAIADKLTSLIIINVVMLPTMFICEGLAPQRLEIGADKLVILRRYKSITIHSNEVKSIELLPANALKGAIRTGGVSGFFGYYGNFYLRSIGAVKLYATDFNNLYLVKKWDGKQIVFSCSDPELLDKTFKLN